MIKCDIYIYMVHLKDKAKIDICLVWSWNTVEGKENNFCELEEYNRNCI